MTFDPLSLLVGALFGALLTLAAGWLRRRQRRRALVRKAVMNVLRARPPVPLPARRP